MIISISFFVVWPAGLWVGVRSWGKFSGVWKRVRRWIGNRRLWIFGVRGRPICWGRGVRESSMSFLVGDGLGVLVSEFWSYLPSKSTWASSSSLSSSSSPNSQSQTSLAQFYFPIILSLPTQIFSFLISPPKNSNIYLSLSPSLSSS